MKRILTAVFAALLFTGCARMLSKSGVGTDVKAGPVVAGEPGVDNAVADEGRIYPIVVYGDKVLRKRCEPIAPGFPGLKTLIGDMFLTLEEAEGVGLAAPQIGRDIRLFIVDCTPWGEEDPSCADYKRAFINAEIYAMSEEKKSYNEGCLSFPDIRAEVQRSLTIRMRYLDEEMQPRDEEFTGFKAWVIQHEYDHIEGKVFIDRTSRQRKNRLKGELRNLARGKYHCTYKTK